MDNEWLWTKSPVAFTSRSRVEQFIRARVPSPEKRRKALEAWREYAANEVESLQLYAPHRLDYKDALDSTRVSVPRRNAQWQMDLVDLSKQPKALKRLNKEFVFILVGIDVLSRFVVSVVPLKRKNGEDVSRAMEKVYARYGAPALLHVDRGKEFYNAHVHALNKKHGVHMFSSHSEYKAAIVERFNRTLKERVKRAQARARSNRWIDFIDDAVDGYNDTPHSSLSGYTPRHVYENDDAMVEVWARQQRGKRRSAKFRVGDRVRVHRSRFLFEKGSTRQVWSDEVFLVRHVLPGGYVKLEDLPAGDVGSEAIEGRFFERELKKANEDDDREYPIEKIIKRRDGRALVKFRGWPEKYNAWVRL